MIKVFANFLLAIASMSVPVAAGSFMHVYTEDKKPTSFEELKFQTIIEIPDEEKVDEPEDEPEEEEETVADAGKNNSAAAAGGGSTVNVAANTGSSPQVSVTTPTKPQAPITSQKKPQSQPVITKPVAPPPQPSTPVLPSPPPQVPVPPPPSQPSSGPGTMPPGGATPDGTVPNNTKGIEMTMDALKHFVDQEVSKNASASSADEFKANWQTAITALSTLDDDVKKSLLELFQLS